MSRTSPNDGWPDPGDRDEAAGTPRRLCVYSAGFWRQPRLARILTLAGWRPCLGLPDAAGHVGIWGGGARGWRGRAVARLRGARLVTIEDAFLRSILPGRARHRSARRGPIGLLIDPVGCHFDPTAPSLIERLALSPRARALRAEAREAIARLRALDLSKYNAHLDSCPPPPAGYVLVIDQTRGDASLMGAGRAVFLKMLRAARDEHPGRPIVLRSHPETAQGLRPGHLGPRDLRAGETLCDAPVSPWRLIENAHAVYAVTSQLGYEAVLAGHRPRIFGQPFYAGWGLTEDEEPLPHQRRRPVNAETLFAASHMLAPTWYDPCRDRLTDLAGALDQLSAEARVWRQDHAGHLAYGIRLWKRGFMAAEFGSVRPLRFTRRPGPQVTLAWADKAAKVPCAIRIEDGFVRSRGLGASLVQPLSLIADDLGMHYDPGRESRLERLIAAGPPPGGAARAQALIARLCAMGLTKYNLDAAPLSPPSTSGRPVILVPGQVEDDASIRLGAGVERTNLALLERVRRENPDAFVIYKPHPDVEAGLRPGQIPAAHLDGLADLVAHRADPVRLIEMADEVWTITSTLGFEALIRGRPVTTLGAPFYAGWGLTRDLGPIPARRRARPPLADLAHAVLIAYPRYRDPKSGLPCPPEVILDRLADPARPAQPPALRLLAKAQGALAGHSWLWR